MTIENVGFNSCDVNLVSSIKIIHDLREIDSLCSQKNPGPILAEYRPGKRVANCPAYTEEQIKLWKDALSRAKNCFIIGLRLNKADEHIWVPLSEARCNVFYYSPDDASLNEIKKWKNGRKGSVYAIKNTFRGAIVDIKQKLNLQ